jgi:hypothetical protein
MPVGLGDRQDSDCADALGTRYLVEHLLPSDAADPMTCRLSVRSGRKPERHCKLIKKREFSQNSPLSTRFPE